MIILLNGPPGCGKDTAAEFIKKRLNCREYKFSAPLKSALRELLSIDSDRWSQLLAYGAKDEPLLPQGVSIRQALIKLSEEYLKPMLGQDIFGHIAVRRMKRMVSASHIVVSDIGFTQEVVPVLDEFTVKRIRILQISRTHCTFKDDSREYIDVEQLKMVPYTKKIANKYDLELFEAQVVRVLKDWELVDGDD